MNTRCFRIQERFHAKEKDAIYSIICPKLSTFTSLNLRFIQAQKEAPQHVTYVLQANFRILAQVSAEIAALYAKTAPWKHLLVQTHLIASARHALLPLKLKVAFIKQHMSRLSLITEMQVLL